jgi:hypothetical protein
MLKGKVAAVVACVHVIEGRLGSTGRSCGGLVAGPVTGNHSVALTQYYNDCHSWRPSVLLIVGLIAQEAFV